MASEFDLQKIQELKEVDESILSAWEMDFVESVIAQVESRGRDLSEKQLEIVKRILEKA